MNERIRELALQAGLEMCGCGCDMPTRQLVKFAELLVNECAELATKEYNNRSSIHGNDLLQHFGVER